MHFIFQDALMNRKHLFDIEILCNIIHFCLMCRLLNKNVNSEMFLTGSSRC